MNILTIPNYNPWYSAGTARSTATAAWRGSTVTATTATVSTAMDKPGTATVVTRNRIIDITYFCFNSSKCVKTTYKNTCINIGSTCDRTSETSCIVFVCLGDAEREHIAVPLLS